MTTVGRLAARILESRFLGGVENAGLRGVHRKILRFLGDGLFDNLHLLRFIHYR